MLRRLLCSFIPVILTTTIPAWGDDTKKDEDKLQGTWQATEGVGNGKPIPKEQIERVKVVFSGDKMRFYPPDGDGKKALEFTFKVDASKKPSTIDATRSDRDQTAPGIYQLEGDTLKLCLPIRPGKERPTELAAPEASGLVLLTLKRVKK